MTHRRYPIVIPGTNRFRDGLLVHLMVTLVVMANPILTFTVYNQLPLRTLRLSAGDGVHKSFGEFFRGCHAYSLVGKSTVFAVAVQRDRDTGGRGSGFDVGDRAEIIGNIPIDVSTIDPSVNPVGV